MLLTFEPDKNAQIAHFPEYRGKMLLLDIQSALIEEV